MQAYLIGAHERSRNFMAGRLRVLTLMISPNLVDA